MARRMLVAGGLAWLLVVTCFAAAAGAAGGGWSIDMSYGNGGQTLLGNVAGQRYVRAHVMLGDGSMLVATYDGPLVKVDPHGQHDVGFEAALPAFGEIESLAIDSVGRILVGARTGSLTAGATVMSIHRVLPSGRPDPSFGDDGSSILYVDDSDEPPLLSISTLPDGRIGVSYQVIGIGADSWCDIALLTATGQHDITWNSGVPYRLGADEPIATLTECGSLFATHAGDLAFVIKSDGIYIISGNGPVTARLLEASHRFPGSLVSVEQTSTGAFIIAGDTNRSQFVVGEVDLNGSYTASFNDGAPLVVNFHDMYVNSDNESFDNLGWAGQAPDGAIIAVGQTLDGYGIVRFVDGHQDASFGNNGRYIFLYPYPSFPPPYYFIPPTGIDPTGAIITGSYEPGYTTTLGISRLVPNFAPPTDVPEGRLVIISFLALAVVAVRLHRRPHPAPARVA